MMLVPEIASPGQMRSLGKATASLVALIAVAGLYVVAAPQPESDSRLGATRPSAVAPGTAPVSDPTRLAEVKIIGATADSSKPCDEQTWPYIDQRCLIPVSKDAPRDAEEAPLPLGLLALLGVKAPTIPVSEAPQAAPEAPAQASQPLRDGNVAAAIHDPTIPLPQSRPNASVADLSMDDDDALEPPPVIPLSRTEQRRMEREWRRMERAERRALQYSNRMLHREYRQTYRGRDMRYAPDRFIP
jgi:hypothetical protein